MDNGRQCSRKQYNASTHVSTPPSSNTVEAAGQSMEVLQQKLDQANAHLTSLSLRLASTVDALDVQAKAAGRDAALATEENRTLTRKLAILEAKYLGSEYERQDMQLAITELMDKISRPHGFETLSPPALRLTSFLDQPSTPHVSTETPDSTVESYANNVINFLTSNLKNERVERERLASEAEGQTRRLRAQLARREAEMQALLVGKERNTELPIQIHESKSAEHASIELVLESQNRTLEIEIEELKSQLRAQAAKLRSPSASVTERAGRHVSPSPEHFDTIPSAVHSPSRAPEELLFILDHQKELLEHQKQTLTATRQQLREQAVSLQPNDEPVQPSAQAPEDSKAGFERILLIEEECMRLLESERAARKEILDLKDRELCYLQAISDLRFQAAELRARLDGRQSNATALEARGRHLNLPVNTLDIQERGSVPPSLDSLQSLSPISSPPVSADVFGLLSLPATTFSSLPHRPRSPKSDLDKHSLNSFMPRRSECARPQQYNSMVLPPLLHEQRDATTGRESVTRNSPEDEIGIFSEPLNLRIRRLEAELARARREADEGSTELRHLRAEVARLNAGSPVLPSNPIEFRFLLPQAGL